MTVHIVQLQSRHRPVARREEARQIEVGDHWLPHGQRLGRRPDTLIGPGHRHDAELAVVVARRQNDARPASAIGAHDPRPQRHGLYRCSGQRRAAKLIAAEIDVRRSPQIGIQQPAVIVAIVDCERALAKIPVDRVGTVELRQSEDALVDRGNGHIGMSAKTSPADRKRHDYRRVRIDLGRAAYLHGQTPILGIQWDVHQTQRPTRDRGGHWIARLNHGHQDIGPATPSGRGL